MNNNKASYASAISSLDNAESKYKRKLELYDNKLLSLELLETAKNEYISAKSKLEQVLADSDTLKLYPEKINIKKTDITDAEEAVNKAEIALEESLERKRETRIFAPISGIILKQDVAVGQIISSGISNVGGGTLLCSIADLSKLYVTASVDESDIGKIAVDQSVVITVDAYPRIKFEGVIERVAPEGTSTSNVTVFKIKINITDERRKRLKSGMTASVDIILDTREDVLYAPVSAIKENKGEIGVYVKEAAEKDKNAPVKKLKWIPVKRGFNDGSNVEISGNIKEGDEILTSSLKGQDAKTKGSGQRGGGMRMGGGMMRGH